MEVTRHEDEVGPRGVVDYNGSQFEISLAFTPDAKPGDWVLVHAGFAISEVDETEAREIWDVLGQAGDAALDEPVASEKS